MGDMSPIIIPKSDQINADELLAGPMTIQVVAVNIKAGTEQPVSIDFGHPGKVFRPCKTVCKLMVNVWGPDSKNYVGKSMTLYRDPKVKWGGLEVGGIRISHMSHLDKEITVALLETRSVRKPITVRPLRDAPRSAPQPPSEPASEPILDDPIIDDTSDAQDYADNLEHRLDQAPTRAERITIFNTAMKAEKAQLAELRAVDAGRYDRLKVKAAAGD